MNKGLKKGLGALAAVASLLALGPLAAANAAQPTRTRIDAFANDGTIAVESADGRTDISKHTINAYLLAPYTSAVATGDTLNEYAVSTGTGYADKVTAAVKTAFPDADKGADGWQVALGDATTTLDEANPMDWVARNLLDSDASPWAGGLRDFVTKLTASLKGNIAFPAGAKTLTPTAGAPAKQTADGLTPGIYLIIDTAIGSESAAPSLAGTTFGTVTKYSFAKDGQAQPATGDLGKVEYKVLPYETAKAIESVRGSATAEVADDGASAKANIGDVINYRVQVGPIWTTGYDAGRTLKARDSLNAGQTFDISSVKAYTYDAPADGGALDEATKQTLTPAKADKDGNRTVWALDDKGTKADYSVTATKGGDGTTVAFGFYNENNLLDADAAKFEGKVVVLEYSAKLNRNAVVGGTGNENAVTWTIGNNPQDPTSTDERTDKTHVYTSSVRIAKIDNATKAAIDGAEFGVTDKDGKAVRFTKLDDGTYAVADSTDKYALGRITVNSKTLNGGATTIRGLYGGGYTFTEAKAPEGYIGLLLPSFKVSATLDEGSNAAKMAVTDLGASRLVSFDAKADANAGRVTVANAKSLKDLPKTGAAGIALMSLVAAVLMACGAALILSRKRRA
jgi:LPXTG-motif cell wall-anchored protein